MTMTMTIKKHQKSDVPTIFPHHNDDEQEEKEEGKKERDTTGLKYPSTTHTFLPEKPKSKLNQLAIGVIAIAMIHSHPHRDLSVCT